MTKTRCLLFFAAILFAATVSASCGRPRETAEENTARADDQTTSPTAEALHGFESDLLLSDARTIRFQVELPEIRAPLSDATPYNLFVRIVVECANGKTQSEVKSKKDRLAVTAQTVISEKNLAFISSVTGKIDLQDEIVAALKKELDNKAVKQVYYKNYVIERGS